MSEAGQTEASKSGARFRIVRAVTPEERAAAFALRYQVYVQEQGYVIPGVDSGEGLADPEDERAFILIGYDGETAAGTIAADGWGDGDWPPSRIADFHLDGFAKAFGRSSVFFLRKTAIAPRYRKSSPKMRENQKPGETREPSSEKSVSNRSRGSVGFISSPGFFHSRCRVGRRYDPRSLRP